MSNTVVVKLTAEQIKESIRIGALKWCRENKKDWRDKVWYDGIIVDLDDPKVVEYLADYIINDYLKPTENEI